MVLARSLGGGSREVLGVVGVDADEFFAGDVAELLDWFAEPVGCFGGEFGEGVDGELAGSFEPNEGLDLWVGGGGHRTGYAAWEPRQTSRLALPSDPGLAPQREVFGRAAGPGVSYTGVGGRCVRNG